MSNDELKNDMKKAGFIALSLVIGLMAKNALRYTWKKTSAVPPPENPAKSGVKVHHAILWTTLLSIASGLSKLALNYALVETQVKDVEYEEVA